MCIRDRDKVGLLDESFFMYGEDIDLSYRIVLGGYKNLYVPERILHYKGESTKHGDLRYIRAFYGAMLIFYKKYYPGAGWLMRILIRLAVLLKACWAMISAPLRKKAKAVKHRRLLILCREDHFEEVKAVCLKAMPDLEFVNLWDLDVERVMDAICRKMCIRDRVSSTPAFLRSFTGKCLSIICLIPASNWASVVPGDTLTKLW